VIVATSAHGNYLKTVADREQPDKLLVSAVPVLNSGARPRTVKFLNSVSCSPRFLLGPEPKAARNSESGCVSPMPL